MTGIVTYPPGIPWDYQECAEHQRGTDSIFFYKAQSLDFIPSDYWFVKTIFIDFLISLSIYIFLSIPDYIVSKHAHNWGVKLPTHIRGQLTTRLRTLNGT